MLRPTECKENLQHARRKIPDQGKKAPDGIAMQARGESFPGRADPSSHFPRGSILVFHVGVARRKIFASATIQAPFGTIRGCLRPEHRNVAYALKIVAIHGDEDCAIAPGGSLDADADVLPDAGRPAEFADVGKAARVAGAEANARIVRAREHRKRHQRRAVLAIHRLELKNMTEPARAVKVCAGAPRRRVFKRLAVLLMRADALDLRALTAGVVPVAVAVSPVTGVIAQRHPHGVAAGIGDVREIVGHKPVLRDEVFHDRFFNALETGQVRCRQCKGSCGQRAKGRSRDEEFHGRVDGNRPALVTLP